MEIINFVATLPILFFKALNGGKTNACCAILSLMIMFIVPVFIGTLLSKRKWINIPLFCQAILLSVIFMIYGRWVIVLGIAVGVVFYRKKFSGKLAA